MNKEQEILNNQFKMAISELERHADKANSEMGKIQIHIEGIKTDISWIKRAFWIIATGVATGIIGIFFELIKSKL